MTNLILSKSEENYLKSIYNLSELGNKVVTTNSISKILNIEPASVTDMIKKLSKKKLIYHEKYRGTKISKNGIKVALQIIRRHRLWEVFLYEKLNFNWDEIHEVAEELEHVSSDQLIDNLDKYLKYPKIDPHGDPIPNKLGEIDFVDKISISDLKKLNYNKKLGFIFGSEASGLSNKEISYANYTLNIPTNDKFKSLNLSHSVIIIAQIISSILNSKVSDFSKSKKINNASKKNVYRLATFVIDNLDKMNFFKPIEKKPIMLENLRSIFYKMELSEKEIRILSSVFAQFLKKKVN